MSADLAGIFQSSVDSGRLCTEMWPTWAGIFTGGRVCGSFIPGAKFCSAGDSRKWADLWTSVRAFGANFGCGAGSIRRIGPR